VTPGNLESLEAPGLCHADMNEIGVVE
jgi:hypothetical protein